MILIRWLARNLVEGELGMHLTGGLLVGSLILILANCQPFALQPDSGEGAASTTVLTQIQQETPQMTNKVTAEVILRSPGGKSILDATEGVTAATIDKYRVGKEMIDEASGKLIELGFETVQTGPVGVTITGDQATFEKVFQTKLVRQGGETRGIPGAFYQAEGPLQIPEKLASLVAAVSLPVPPEFYP